MSSDQRYGPSPYGPYQIVKCEKCGKEKYDNLPCSSCTSLEEYLDFLCPKKVDEFGSERRMPFNGYYDTDALKWKYKCSLCSTELDLVKDCSRKTSTIDLNSKIVITCPGCKMRVEFNSNCESESKKAKIKNEIERLQNELAKLEGK